MRSPLFSVVTISFNASSTIEETIISVSNQNYNNYEYIIVDGGSNDGTLEIINKYRNRIDVFISEPDGGIYNAMNKAASLASGEYIIYMNSNDVFAGENILQQVNDAVGDSKYSMVYGDYFLKINESKYLIHAKSKMKGSIITSHQSIFCKRSLILEFKFDEKLKLAADYKLTSILFLLGPNLSLNFPVCVMEGIGFSSDKKNQILKEYFSINRKLFGLLYALIIFLKVYISMVTSNFLSSIGLGEVRNYLRKFKGWKVIE
jgi:glycosyltransferase involved in cell wall biosynthesis